MEAQKIDLCGYGSHNIESVRAQIQRVIVEGNVHDLQSVFQNIAYRPQRTQKVSPKLSKITGIPPGKTQHIIFRCPVSHGNVNEWFLAVLEDEAGQVVLFDLYLFYRDEDFSKRNERLSPERFESKIALSRAVQQVARTRPVTRQKFREELLGAGFLLHFTCETEGKGGDVTDIYVVPPVPPESLNALMGAYFSPDLRPNVAITFSAQGHFLEAKPGSGPEAGNCRAYWKLYGEQTNDWLKAHYPKWYSETIDRLKKRRQNKKKE